MSILELNNDILYSILDKTTWRTVLNLSCTCHYYDAFRDGISQVIKNDDTFINSGLVIVYGMFDKSDVKEYKYFASDCYGRKRYIFYHVGCIDDLECQVYMPPCLNPIHRYPKLSAGWIKNYVVITSTDTYMNKINNEHKDKVRIIAFFTNSMTSGLLTSAITFNTKLKITGLYELLTHTINHTTSNGSEIQKIECHKA